MDAVERAVLRPNLVMLDCLDLLRSRGEVKIAILTNDWAGCFSGLEELVEPRADILVRSHREAKRKPEIEIFKL